MYHEHWQTSGIYCLPRKFGQCFTTLMIKKLIPVSFLNLSWCSFVLFLCALSWITRRGQQLPLHFPSSRRCRKQWSLLSVSFSLHSTDDACNSYVSVWILQGNLDEQWFLQAEHSEVQKVSRKGLNELINSRKCFPFLNDMIRDGPRSFVLQSLLISIAVITTPSSLLWWLKHLGTSAFY